MKFDHINSQDISKVIKEKKVALLPIGAVEAHGPHLPLGTDSILAENLSYKVCKKINGLVLPTLYYSQVWSLGNFKGTIGISTTTLKVLIKEIIKEVHRNEFKIVAIINTHLGNLTAIKEAAREAMKELPEDFKIFYFTYPGADKVISEVMDSSKFHKGFFHADEIETSYMLYLAKEYVDMDKAVNGNPKVSENMEFTPMRWDLFTETAVMGDATLATEKKGEIVIENVINNITKVLNKYI
ncbi:creatininase family protein [Clostridium oceanicum]|uniref:Creatininase family protein n=1 Tax=Clostridium oceanicum TaxID=1543 RepID=A0ABN1J930_9CLOT